MLKRLSAFAPSYVARAVHLRPCAKLPKAGSLSLQRAPQRWGEGGRRLFASPSVQRQDAVSAITSHDDGVISPAVAQQAVAARTKALPTVCPGCGAHSQTVQPHSAGYYDVRRARNDVKKQSKKQEDDVFRTALSSGSLSSATKRAHDTPFDEDPLRSSTTPSTPICDRCHDLLYQSRGTSIIHPSMQSIQAIIEESPYKHNHIYHVLDAADFPMSLIPNLQHALDLPRLRTRNRRSKSVHYLRGRVAEVSFIITRSDLLAPKKEQVDTLMPYLQDVLRDALGRTGRKVRLGNVRCVSAKRGWWTKTVKEEVWGRGGAGWMVGKVNVGKSALFDVVFPKGRGQKETDLERLRTESQNGHVERTTAFATSTGELGEGVQTADTAERLSEELQESELQLERNIDQDDPEDEPFTQDDSMSLLPPAQPETAYPVMPLVSSLPGTTASPIRIPFGAGKGELIDLPGIQRSNLESHVKPNYKKDLVMKTRVVPEQYSIRPGQSLLLGGLIRISHPSTSVDDPSILAYPFVPPSLTPHVTGTHKAIAIQTGVHSAESRGLEGEAYTGTIPSIATDPAKAKVKSAGTFKLEWNVTKRRTGPLTDLTAGKQKADALPFIVYSADILIESVGWVELVCQVRRRSESLFTHDALTALEIGGMEGSRGGGVPEVEVFSPEGKFVGVRRPMNAWVLGGRKEVPVYKRRERPRQTISMGRRREGGRRGSSLA